MSRRRPRHSDRAGVEQAKVGGLPKESSDSWDLYVDNGPYEPVFTGPNRAPVKSLASRPDSD